MFEREPFGIDFVTPARRYLAPFFVLFCFLAAMAFIVAVLLVIEVFSYNADIEKNSLLLERYRDLGQKTKASSQAKADIERFQENLARIGTLKTQALDPRLLLAVLEGKKPNNVMYTAIEYKSRGNRCVLEFESADTVSVNTLLHDLEAVPEFLNVTVLNKERGNRERNPDRYSVEVKF